MEATYLLAIDLGKRHFVAVKDAEHQPRTVAFRTHQCFVRQRTQLINALRGHLAEEREIHML